jgi:hypothetical protein
MMQPTVTNVPAVGQRICVWWTTEQQWYSGTCVQVVQPAADEDPADPTVHIHYDDGVALEYSAQHLASGKGWEAASGPAGRGQPAESMVARQRPQAASRQSLEDTRRLLSKTAQQSKPGRRQLGGLPVG